MAKLEAGDKSSNSLLANVLDMDDDFLLAGGLRSNFTIFDLSLILIAFSLQRLWRFKRGAWSRFRANPSYSRWEFFLLPNVVNI